MLQARLSGKAGQALSAVILLTLVLSCHSACRTASTSSSQVKALANVELHDSTLVLDARDVMSRLTVIDSVVITWGLAPDSSVVPVAVSHSRTELSASSTVASSQCETVAAGLLGYECQSASSDDSTSVEKTPPGEKGRGRGTAAWWLSGILLGITITVACRAIIRHYL